jgi:hypothetical protein
MLTDTLMAIGAVIVAVLGWWANNRRIARNAKQEGREEAEQTARRLDHENAAAIRKRAAAPKRVQSTTDKRGFRD